MHMDTDVLIVGAGPTGLMLANQLARRGVRTLCVDRRDGPARETRALGVQARTLEIYSHLGLAERAVALGKRGTGANLWAEGRRTARVPLADAGRHASAYPYILILGQDDNEKLLGGRLRELGGGVEWNTTLLAVEERGDHVVATLRDRDGGERRVTAAWVAGCDGARSTVRELAGVGFPGAPYDHVFYVADVEAKGAMVPDEVNVYLWRDGFHLFFPMRGDDHWRVVGILPKALRHRDGVRFEDVLPSLHQEAGAGLAFDACSWFSTYRIHHRHAARFRAGRCFLLGDAAHVHSPVGAQGMNTGLQDAYNLAWKLALVVQGRAREALLDTYEAERLPVAKRLLATTDTAFRLIVSDHWLAGLLRTKIAARVAAAAMRFVRVQQFAFRTVSQVGVHYRRGPLARGAADWPEAAPRAGDRFPWLHLRFRPGEPARDVFERLGDTRFHLLVAGQPLPAGLPAAGGLLRVHVLPDDVGNTAELARTGIPRRAFFLVRPDGHIGLCGTRLEADAVVDYLERHVQLEAATVLSPTLAPACPAPLALA
jgi:2-polyprenyl-6-methoxyphenol hydroxylase-like FAD-dependent oxidoreductase